MVDSETIAADLLRGGSAIARFIGESERRTFYLLEHGFLPAGKVGASWVASKAALRAPPPPVAVQSGQPDAAMAGTGATNGCDAYCCQQLIGSHPRSDARLSLLFSRVLPRV